ncbi:CocE/NonD family hydrolase [Marmoricola sp. URHB0036]|uniref:CocE/NonD family hydrolase n=1 Tax=Marmoricola sp. URHB0036 TaxID=1298863 RepID=UPI00041C3960|nr:CocE/NonD family hydrolase [Marmoricola sp. URHB0036]
MPGTEREVRIAMPDGVRLSATLYLPAESVGPQPCLLEALPYRKDDLTSSYAESYVTLRDEHGYAVCRLDLRGTGSSEGDATDEYPEAEQTDLVEVIAWLADQPWCDGKIGMWGTSYSGFNSLQIACERPPALKVVCAIYASDDRWTDDVHWRGGALRLVDLVDYDHYMTPMCVLPPVPAVWGDSWRDEWRRRLEVNEPWVLTWLRENRDGPYWRHGSVRTDGEGHGYDRIDCAVMVVAGWADGYRNNSFRTIEALAEASVPHRLLAGPWVHADPTTAYPGPRIDLDREMVAWWDRWLRGRDETPHRDVVDVFVRTTTRPEAFLDQHAGHWIRDVWPSPSVATQTWQLDGPRELAVQPDTGTAAWIDCAGHLPWGLSTDQRDDDARSLVWEWTGASETVLGHPRVRLRVSADAPQASLSVKLCDVFPDGTSALISRGSLDLAFRDGVHAPASPSPLVPGEEYDVEVVLDACAYQLAPGQALRLSIAGADWPNTVAPPAPVTLTVHAGSLKLPLQSGAAEEPPAFTPGAPTSSEEPDGVSWTVSRDVLRNTTTCAVRHGAEYDVPYDGRASEQYAGDVVVHRRTFAQHASADCTYRLTWPEVDVSVSSTMRVDVTAAGYDVVIDLDAFDDGDRIAHRTWSEHIPR